MYFIIPYSQIIYHNMYEREGEGEGGRKRRKRKKKRRKQNKIS